MQAEDLTEQQIAEFKEAFLLFDKDADGRISADELNEIMLAMDQNPTELEIKAMISVVDLNRNGTIEFDEFLVMMANKIKEFDTQHELRETFKLFDKDGDGVISVEEFREVMRKFEGYNIPKEEVEKLIQGSDTDGDGTVNYQEFVIMMMTGKVTNPLDF